MRIELRAATPGDVDTIAELWCAEWLGTHEGQVPRRCSSTGASTASGKRVPVRLPTTTVAVADRRLAGFVMTHVDEIEQLYVEHAPRHRRGRVPCCAMASRRSRNGSRWRGWPWWTASIAPAASTSAAAGTTADRSRPGPGARAGQTRRRARPSLREGTGYLRRSTAPAVAGSVAGERQTPGRARTAGSRRAGRRGDPWLRPRDRGRARRRRSHRVLHGPHDERRAVGDGPTGDDRGDG